MKSSKLIASVMYEPWMIMPEAASAYLPVIGQWLKGEPVVFDAKDDRLGLMYVSAGGAGIISPGYPEDISNFPKGSIGIVNLKGEMTKYDGLCNWGTMSISGIMKMLGVSDNISGVVLDIDGPGGAVNAIAPMIEAIKFLQDRGKPVVVHGDMVASAHLYVAVHGDYFMVDNEASWIGSIGTLIEFRNYQKYYEDMGIDVRRIYAPESTHKNLPFEKAMEGDDGPMKEKVLSPLAKQFQRAVIEKRNGKLNEGVEGILSGAMFFGRDNVKHGLADGMGTLGDAVQMAFDMVEIRKFMRIS